MEDDKREYQRIIADQSVQILDGDRVLPALALDLSLMGLQVLCDAATAERIAHRLNEGDEEIRVRMPCANGGIDAWCSVIYMRHVGDDACRLGLEYQEFLDGSYDWLERFMDDGGVQNGPFVIQQH